MCEVVLRSLVGQKGQDRQSSLEIINIFVHIAKLIRTQGFLCPIFTINFAIKIVWALCGHCSSSQTQYSSGLLAKIVVMNEHQHDTCYDEIQQCTQIININLGSQVNTNERGMCDPSHYTSFKA